MDTARWLLGTALLFSVWIFQSCATMSAMREEPLVYHVGEVLDGGTNEHSFTFTFSRDEPGIIIRDAMYHRDYMRKHATISPDEPGALRMVMAYQLMPGKTRSDIARFKELDRPWVAENNGYNSATYFTDRAANWPFDAFEDITFKSKADFERAYAGNETMAKAGEGLFDKQVLVFSCVVAGTK